MRDGEEDELNRGVYQQIFSLVITKGFTYEFYRQ